MALSSVRMVIGVLSRFSLLGTSYEYLCACRLLDMCKNFYWHQSRMKLNYWITGVQMFKLGYDAKLFSKVTIPGHAPPAPVGGPVDPHPLQPLEMVKLFKFSRSKCGLICISVITKDNYYCSACSLAVCTSSPQCFTVSTRMSPIHRELL